MKGGDGTHKLTKFLVAALTNLFAINGQLLDLSVSVFKAIWLSQLYNSYTEKLVCVNILRPEILKNYYV